MSDEIERPPSIGLIALVNLVIGIYAISIAFSVVYNLSEDVLTMVGTIQVGALVIGILHLIGAFGIWMLKPWGRWISLGSASVGLVLNIAIVTMEPLLLIQYFIPMAIRLLILGYLMSTRGKEIFYPDIY